MRHLAVALGTFYLLSFHPGAQAGENSHLLQNGKQAYQQGDFDRARSYFEQYIMHGGPNERKARYYLANSFMGLGKLKSAADHYALLALTPSADEYTSASRNNLWMLRNRFKVTSIYDDFLLYGRHTSGHFTANPAPHTLGAPNRAAQEAIRSQQVLLARKIEQDAQREIAEQQNLLFRTLETINRRLREQMTSCNNLDDRDKAYLAQRAARERAHLAQQFAQKTANIRENAAEKIARLGMTVTSMEDKFQCDRGAVGLMPSGTSLYVQNYINFPDQAESDRYSPPPVGLSAGPAKSLVRQAQGNTKQ